MADRVALLVGTRKGAFIAESDAARHDWTVRGPMLQGQNVMHMTHDPRDGALLAAVGDPWFGSRVYRSTDFGETWVDPQAGPTFPADLAQAGRTVEKIWHVQPGRPEEPGVLYAGIEPAALFKSSDLGQSWELVRALEEHPTRAEWMPAQGGLCLHSIVLDPHDVQHLYIGISAAGTFESRDGGASWQPVNQGTRVNFLPDQPSTYADYGQCVHKLASAPARPGRIYQQSHCGIYRSDDAAASWVEITEGLPSDFGFGIVASPNDPDTIWVCPSISGYEHWMPGARVVVYRSRDDGAHWQALDSGLPGEGAYLNVLREGIAVDAMPTPGVYIGTNTGQLFASNDEGDHWDAVPAFFPPISSVTAVTR